MPHQTTNPVHDAADLRHPAARPRPSSAAALAGLLLAPVLAGCATEPAPATTARDSAGVRVVESRRPAWSDGEGWRVDPEPLMDIGGEGSPGPRLHGVISAARLPDGGLVVADGTDRLLFLDASGRPGREAGGAGDGPGEYRMIAAAGAAGDTIWSYDYSLRRITRHGTRGEPLGVVPLRTERTALLPVGRLPDGSFVLAPSYSEEGAARAVWAGLRRDTVVYLRFGADGEESGKYGRFPAREYVMGEEGGRRTMAAPLFARSASHALLGDRLVHGDTERYELRVVRPDGTLELLIRRIDPEANVTVGEADRAAELERRLGAHGREDPGLRRFLAELPAPGTRPAHGPILVDAEGFLWVASYEPGVVEPERWSVFEAAGRWLGDVAFPPRFRPLQIRGSEVIGVRRDALDVEHLQVLALSRP